MKDYSLYAIYNGAKYIKEQFLSLLKNLVLNDEIINFVTISNYKTIEIIRILKNSCF